MTLDKWLLLIGLFFILVDIFFDSDMPTFLSFILFTIVICRRLSSLHIMLRMSVGIIVFFTFVFIYYFVWGRFKKYFVDKWFAKDIMKSGMDALVGVSGTVRIIDGIQAAQIYGDLYPFEKPVIYDDGTPFVVKGVQGGKIIPEFSQSVKQTSKKV